MNLLMVVLNEDPQNLSTFNGSPKRKELAITMKLFWQFSP